MYTAFTGRRSNGLDYGESWDAISDKPDNPVAVTERLQEGGSPLERTGSAQRAYQLIRGGIIEGRYRPGERIVEETIGKKHNLSRTPVREALRILEAEGLVLIERNRGAVVRSLSSKDIEDLYELRAKLESLAAERAAQRCTPADLTALDAAIEQFTNAIPENSTADVKRLRALSAANERFHGIVLRMADHSRLSQILTRTVDIPLVFQSFRKFDHDERVRSNLFHQLVRGAIAAGDAERAGRLMSEHILMARDALANNLSLNAESLDGAGGDR